MSVLVAVIAAGTLAGCDGRSNEADTVAVTTEAAAATTETTEVTTTSAPIRCLNAAGLSDVGERDVGVWSGLHEDPAYAIVVHKLAKPAKAPMVVAGTYAVTGSFKVAAEGEGLGIQEGLLADALVQDVANCLGG